MFFLSKLTTIFAIFEDTGSTAAPGEEGQCWRHQPVDDAALPRTQCQATRCRLEERIDKNMSAIDVLS